MITWPSLARQRAVVDRHELAGTGQDPGLRRQCGRLDGLGEVAGRRAGPRRRSPSSRSPAAGSSRRDRRRRRTACRRESAMCTIVRDLRARRRIRRAAATGAPEPASCCACSAAVEPGAPAVAGRRSPATAPATAGWTVPGTPAAGAAPGTARAGGGSGGIRGAPGTRAPGPRRRRGSAGGAAAAPGTAPAPRHRPAACVRPRWCPASQTPNASPCELGSEKNPGDWIGHGVPISSGRTPGSNAAISVTKSRAAKLSGPTGCPSTDTMSNACTCTGELDDTTFATPTE